MSPVGAAALFALLLVLVVGGAFAVLTYNAVVALRVRIDKAWGNVEVTLRQRHDQLPALVDAVRDVMAFEQEVLAEVTRQRARYVPEAPIPEQGAVSAATTAAVRSLFAVVERYPEVRSHENVLRLQGEIERLEAQIADRRELYNDQVYRYNATIAQVPAVALAALFGWRARPFFEAGDVERPVVRLAPAAAPASGGEGAPVEPDDPSAPGDDGPSAPGSGATGTAGDPAGTAGPGVIGEEP